ncbi:hypothetical protein OVA13_12880 [Pseudoxanthomonas sp. SL93]|uniref:hypothetical protein n=1 Tax=Pseudoxanthomonas sp. SL93 TaxID=2995142 RepID=UPI00226E40D6|nr:hypothetical protein [Pseudoxanthomonas sp. SL93]WAC62279.1 hypothetical protein OVA13_12880 [Pseudoxanthomonas sp. SL93]
MRIIAATVASILVAAGCSGQAPQLPQADRSPNPIGSFFVGVDSSKLPEPARSAVVSAERDIDLVLRGHPPACKDSPDSGESDGGTLHYKCKHYDLTVMRSIYQVGDVYGFIYGPIVTFPGDYPISYVRFYSSQELSALLKQRAGR